MRTGFLPGKGDSNIHILVACQIAAARQPDPEIAIFRMLVVVLDRSRKITHRVAVAVLIARIGRGAVDDPGVVQRADEPSATKAQYGNSPRQHRNTR